MSDQTPEVAVGPSAGRSPRAAIERWLADVAGNSFGIGDYAQLLTEIAAVEPKRVVAAKLLRAGRSLSHHPGRKRLDPVSVITRIIRLVQDGTQALDQFRFERTLANHPQRTLPFVLAAYEKWRLGQNYSIKGGGIRAMHARTVEQWVRDAREAKAAQDDGSDDDAGTKH